MMAGDTSHKHVN